MCLRLPRIAYLHAVPVQQIRRETASGEECRGEKRCSGICFRSKATSRSPQANANGLGCRFFAATHHRFAMHDKNSSMIAAKIVCWRILFVPTLCQTTKAAQAHGGRAVAVPKEERS
jgi:hypothetical protein